MEALVLVIGVLIQACAGSRSDAFIGYSEVALHQRQDTDYLTFATVLGDIEVELASSAAPKTVAFIKDLASRGVYDGCSFYRAEPPGDTLDQGSAASRKGYALVQGGLHSCGKQQEVTLPLETKWKITRGTVSLITGTSEFFFSLEDHPEWDGSFSVWGKVMGDTSFQVLQRIAALPTRQEVHPSGTVLRILEKEVKFAAVYRSG